MWRSVYGLVSALLIAMTIAPSVLAESHPTTPATTGGGTTTVTAVPNTGIGIMTDPAPAAVVLGLLAVAALLALMAVTTWRRQEAS